MAARLVTKIQGGAVYELDDPFSESALRDAASEGEKHLRLTKGQEQVLAEARALLRTTNAEPSEDGSH